MAGEGVKSEVTGIWRVVRHKGLNVRGFSLVELMMVVAVMSVLLVVAAPGMRKMIVDNRVNTTVAELANGLGLARTEAVRINASVLFCASDAKKHWGVAHRSDVDALAADGDFALIIQRGGSLPDEVELVPNGLSEDVDDYQCVRMRPEGLAYVGTNVVGEGVSLTARHEGRERSLTISPGGVHVDPHVSDSE